MSILKGKYIKGLPEVTAIIAAHNEELHIADCIDFLLNQSYKKLKIFVVENGESRDKTYKIANEYEKKYPTKVKAYTIPGKQKGPGNAWNFGIKKAKSEIVMICGADLKYGKEYVANGILPIVEGKTVGLVHKEEVCNNIKNLWARAFFYKRHSAHKDNLSRVFSLVRRDFVLKRPFDSTLGYADDQTIYRKEGIEFPVFDLEVYHTNPASFKDTWEHSIWVGKSIKPWPIILMLPVFPIYSIYKTIKHLKTDFYIPFILFLPIYYSIRYFAYLTDAFNKITEKKN